MNKSNKNKIFIILISLLTMITITLSVLLVVEHRKVNGFKEMSYYEQKVYSYGVQNANLSKEQIVFIGDSITDLYPLDSYYSDLNYATYNRGIGGDTTTGLKERLEVSAYDLNPKVIVMLIGLNDIIGGRTVNDVILTYHEIVKDIREKLPNTKLYCMSTLSLNKEILSSLEHLDEINEQVIVLNSSIKEWSTQYDFTYLDLYSLVTDEYGYFDKQYTDDGIHLNKNGFIVWTNLLKPHLLSYLSN